MLKGTYYLVFKMIVKGEFITFERFINKASSLVGAKRST